MRLYIKAHTNGDKPDLLVDDEHFRRDLSRYGARVWISPDAPQVVRDVLESVFRSDAPPSYGDDEIPF